jgi:hypothetical protein
LCAGSLASATRLSREKQRLLPGEARIVGAQPLGERFEGIVVAKRRFFRGELAEPAHVTPGRLLGVRPGHAEAFEIDELRHAPGPDAGIHRGDVAAHAVADERHRRLGLEVIEQALQVGEIVREPVAVALRPLGEAETAPVGRDHAPVAAQRIHHELERRRHVHPAVQQEELRRARIAPAAAVIAQAAHRDEQGFAGLHEARDDSRGALI